MSNASLYSDSVGRLAEEADAMGRLAQDSGAFAAVAAAFESNDPDAFAWVLQRLEMLPRCELICEWIRVKMCVLRCLQVCGPLEAETPVPELAQFARAILTLASDERLLRRVVDAVGCGNADDYRAAVGELGLAPFCHLLCRWVCSISYRRVCEVVCTTQTLPVADTLTDIRAAAKVIGRVVENENLLAQISKAAVTLDCVTLQSAIGQAGFIGECEIICFLVCAWRCGWACHTLCVRPSPVLAGVQAIEEARNFALAARQLASQPRALGDLVLAVQDRNADLYDTIVARYGLGPYCEQVCAWVCSVLCSRFCFCVCPNPALQPLFTYIGHFDIFTDIDPVSGKTNKGLSFPGLSFNGGPNFAFFGQLQLSGFCPIDSPAFPGIQMKYRFLYTIGAATPQPITGNLVSTVQAGTQAISWPTQSGTNTAVLPMVTVHVPVLVWGPTPSQPVIPPNPVAPALGSTYIAPTPFYIAPDANGWVAVDPNVDGTGFFTLMGFDTTQVTPGPNPAPGVPAGTAVPVAAQRAGTDVLITFEATRVGTFPPGTTADYSQAPVKVHVNNYIEVNELNFVEFGLGNCCTPINQSLSVEFTVDHEEMDAGAWSLSITSCSMSAPGNITPTATALQTTTLATAITTTQTSFGVVSSAGFPPAPFDVLLTNTGELMTVTAVVVNTWTVVRGAGGTTAAAAGVGGALQTGVIVSARGGSGIIGENTSTWQPCSYVAHLATRPGLTTGLIDRDVWDNQLTFCICGH